MTTAEADFNVHLLNSLELFITMIWNYFEFFNLLDILTLMVQNTAFCLCESGVPLRNRNDWFVMDEFIAWLSDPAGFFIIGFYNCVYESI